MSTNKDLANQLAAMRMKAKQAASAEPTAKPAKPEPAPMTPAPTPSVSASRKSRPAKRGRGGQKTKAQTLTESLDRTTITLKAGDSDAISELQTFVMKRVRKASSTSTLIRLALSYTRRALSSDAEAISKAYQQILEEDGRRKSNNV